MQTGKKNSRRLKKEHRFIYGVTLKSLAELKQFLFTKPTTTHHADR